MNQTGDDAAAEVPSQTIGNTARDDQTDIADEDAPHRAEPEGNDQIERGQRKDHRERFDRIQQEDASCGEEGVFGRVGNQPGK